MISAVQFSTMKGKTSPASMEEHAVVLQLLTAASSSSGLSAVRKVLSAASMVFPHKCALLLVLYVHLSDSLSCRQVSINLLLVKYVTTFIVHVVFLLPSI